MKREEQLFIRTLEDLEERINSDDPYEILGVSALIRKLFFDSHPLIDQVNRYYRQKIEFKICEIVIAPNGTPEPSFFTVQDGLDPDTARTGKKTLTVDRDKLYKTVLTVINGKKLTLREIVLFEANVMGGVHAGSAKSEKEKVLDQINQEISVGGYSSSLRQLKAIGRVILKGLAPLKKEVIENN